MIDPSDTGACHAPGWWVGIEPAIGVRPQRCGWVRRAADVSRACRPSKLSQSYCHSIPRVVLSKLAGEQGDGLCHFSSHGGPL